jgi:Radical SAM proteins, N-terminal
VKSASVSNKAIARARLARESGTVFKDAPTRFALAYPSPYHVGMSSLGFQTIYGLLNATPGACAERVFLPDDVEAARSAGPLCTVETQRPAGDCQVVAFSVAYELELTGVFDLLTLMGLPLLSSERSDSHPLIVAGGPLTFSNPDPLEPFVDVLVQGEADDLVALLVDAVAHGGGRAAICARLARLPGFRVPGLSPESTR